MAAEPKPWASRPPDDVLMEPEKFLADLGWSRGSARAAAPAPAAPPVERRYCSFCWAIIAPEARECADCGHSVAEMDADRQSRAAADRAWVPQRMWKDQQPPPRAAAPAPRAVPVSVSNRATLPLPPQPIQAQGPSLNWRHVVFAVGAGGFVGGATVAALWIGMQTLAKPGPVARTGGGAATNGALVALAPATLTWRNPVAELRASLVSQSGAVVAQDAQKEAVTIEPGEYRLRMSDVTGKWAPPEEKVVVGPAETVVVGPSPRVVAGYYLWAGKKLYEEKKADRAERVWAKAVQHYPEGVEARLQLAALMAVRFRYQEARRQAQEVLKRSPGNAEAQRILKALDQLEAAP
jgi:hypothetical protein